MSSTGVPARRPSLAFEHAQRARAFSVAALLGVSAAACGFSGEGTLESGAASTEPPPAPTGHPPPPRNGVAPEADAGPSPTMPVTPCSDPTLSFDGVDDVVTVADDSALDLGGDFTVEAWIKPGSKVATGEEMDVVSHHDPSASRGWALMVKSGRIEIVVWGNENFSSAAFSAGNAGPTYVVAGKWAHIAGTKQGDTLRIYYDGVLRDTQQLDFLFGRDSYAGSLRLGRAAYGEENRYQGEIDDVRLSRTARYTGMTATRPTAKLAADVDTIALWHFDEAGGSKIMDVKSAHDGTMAPDSTAPARVDSTCIASR